MGNDQERAQSERNSHSKNNDFKLPKASQNSNSDSGVSVIHFGSMLPNLKGH